MGLLMKNSLASHLIAQLNHRLRWGVSRPASILRYGVLSVPLNSRRMTSEGVDLELNAAKTRIPTQLPVPISAAFSLYNPHSQS